MKPTHSIIGLLIAFFVIGGCKKTEEKPTESDSDLKITFVTMEWPGNELKDAVEYDAGNKISFKVIVEGKAGLASMQYNFEVVGILDEIVEQGGLGGKTMHEFVMDYTVPANMAGRTLKFKFKVTDNEGNTVNKDMVATIRIAKLDYIGYFSTKETDTVYNNAAYYYDYVFFSTYGVAFQKLEVIRRTNGSNTTLIDTKLPAEVRNGAGASYKYSASYVPAFADKSTNIVETEYRVTQEGGYLFTKTHTLVVIND